MLTREVIPVFARFINYRFRTLATTVFFDYLQNVTKFSTSPCRKRILIFSQVTVPIWVSLNICVAIKDVLNPTISMSQKMIVSLAAIWTLFSVILFSIKNNIPDLVGLVNFFITLNQKLESKLAY